jgi:FAD/FMN-containing dehydrogenase
MEACVKLGGTISGEHGVGMEKSDAMRLVFSEDDLDFQRRLRIAFDPRGLLNPAKVLPPPRDEVRSSAFRRSFGQEPPEGGTTNETLSTAASITPSDAGEACEIVRRACLQRRSLLPCGNGTQLEFGNGPDGTAAALRTVRLSAVVEVDPANQVVAVGAGMRLESLQDLLGQHGQWLPLRPPLAKRHTLGGVVALGACGPERLRYGAPRDLLLGLKFVSGTGRLISAGGRVVKNVAGYDLTRLLAGSAGTLGLLTELTFRVLPIPQCSTAVVAFGPPAQCACAAAALLRSNCEPNFAIVLPGQDSLRADAQGPWQLIAGFEGFQKTVQSQVASCRTLIEKGGLSRAEDRGYSPREGMCRSLFETLYQAPFVLRADVPPDRVAELLAAQQSLLGEAEVLVDFGCGRILASMSSLSDDAWQQWCGAAREAEGHVILEKAAEPFRRSHDVFGPAREDWPLMDRVKAALDPYGVFAPGRRPGRK